MSWSIHASSQSDESLMDDLSPSRLMVSSSGSLAGCGVRDMTNYAVPRRRFGVIFDCRLCCQTSLGRDRTSLPRVYQWYVRTRIDYGCVATGFDSVQLLKTGPPYGTENHRILSVPSHPLQNVYEYQHEETL
ncbi:hypothetical protein TNCV_3847911 [Trichonephila clavipes]|nr:hypothetical protein TNCV_3847911 [Trichonephila clavipes]